jgi:Flp pilus assembly pilin Flp
MGWVKEFLLDVSGTSALEYTLLITFIAVAMIWGVSLLGLATRNNFSETANIFP